MMIARDLRITARDNWPLAATLYEPTGKTGLNRPLGLMILNSEAGVKRQFYADFASHVAARGVAVLTYDYRGIGGSVLGDSAKGVAATLGQWGREDFTGALAWAIENHPDVPPFVLGHGIGGQIAGLADNLGQARSLLLVGAGHGYWRLRDAGRAWRQSWFWHVTVPATVKTLGYLPGGMVGVPEDLPAGVALRWARWARHPDYICGIEPEARAQFAAYNGPITAYSSIDDHMAPPRLVEALLSFYPNAKSTHIPLSPAKVGLDKIGHFGFFDKKIADHLWPRMTEWLRRTVTEVAKEIALEELIEARAIGKIRTPSNAKVIAADLRKTIHEKIAEQTKENALAIPVKPIDGIRQLTLTETAKRLFGFDTGRIDIKKSEKEAATIARQTMTTEETDAVIDLSTQEDSRAARRAQRRQRMAPEPKVQTKAQNKVQSPGAPTEYPSPTPQRPPVTDQQA